MKFRAAPLSVMVSDPDLGPRLELPQDVVAIASLGLLSVLNREDRVRSGENTPILNK